MRPPLHAVGLGPGDRQWVTLRARSLIEEAEVLAWPVGSAGTSRARRIIEPWIHQGHIPLPCPLPIGERDRQRAYGHIAARIHEHYLEERRIVFCCLGDPMFYASFAALLPHLEKRKIAVSIVPGISAIHAGAAAARIPLAADDERFSIIPASRDSDAIRRLLEDGSPGAILKPGRHFPRIRRLLETIDRMKDAYYLEGIGGEDEKVLPLAEKTDDRAPYFALILLRPGDRPS